MNNLIRHADLVMHTAQTESTMLDAKAILTGLESSVQSFLVISDEQMNGTGRNNNHWQSPRGGLWFTYCIKNEHTAHQITLALGLCLYKVLTKHFPDLAAEIQIKWPNDLILDSRKVSGVLVQSYNGWLCMGIGINTNTDDIFLNVPLPPVSLRHYLGFAVSNSALLNSFLDSFKQVYPQFLTAGLGPFKKDINILLFGLNKNIEFDNGKAIISGVCRGISEEGALLLENSTGETSPYYSGSIINATI